MMILIGVTTMGGHGLLDLRNAHVLSLEEFSSKKFEF